MKDIGLVQAILKTRRAARLSAREIDALQAQRLRALLQHVRQNSPYLKEKYRDIPLDAPLSAYPATSKVEMMNNFDRWMTDPAVTRAGVEAFMSDLHNVGREYLGKYLVYTTSGSTGNPCIALYDRSANNVSAAIGMLRSFARPEDFKRFMRSGGKTMGLFADNGFFLATGSVRANLRKMPWKKKQMMTFDVRKPISQIVEALNKAQPSMLGCYPSALQLIAREQEKGRLRIHPVIIMTGGEHLDEQVRAHLQQVFGCYVQTNYSCTEGGTLACECTAHHFHVNEDWVILEAVDEQNQPVPLGTQSSKVLLTNLANRICPFIRFEITDRVVMHRETCSCGKEGLWLTLEGRTDDILTFPGGKQISPFSLYAELEEVKGVQRFQLIQQEDDRLELRLLCDNKPFYFDQAKQRLLRYFKTFDLEPEIYLSQALPQTNPISGKFKHIIAKKS